MKQQSGSTLVISLVLLTIITVVAAYALEGSVIQSKMVANSLFSTITYQECRNEQEANVRQYNENRDALITSMVENAPIDALDTITEGFSINGDYLAPKNDPKSELATSWQYVRDAPAARSGYNLDNESQSKAYLFDHGCVSTFNFSSNSQTLGAIVEGLEQAGAIN